MKMVFSQSLLLLSAIVATAQAGMHVLSVEPYVAEWCAASFPDQLDSVVTGHHMAELIRERSYLLVEPYLGSYCFDIYGHKELKEQKREETLKKMSPRGKHIQVEPYLMEWGQKAMLSPSTGGGLAVPDVETYVTEWCVKGQFTRLMKNKKKAIEDAGQFPVKVEVALVPWCFDQFPDEMRTLDKEFYVKRMQTDHIKIEEYLMKWEIANFHNRNDPRYQAVNTRSGSWGFFSYLLVFAGVVLAVGYAHMKHPHLTQAAQDRVQQLAASLRQQGGNIGASPLSNSPSRYDPLI